jgi:SIR2-like domain
VVHQKFWDSLFRVTRDISVITTNYDILVERVVRHRPMRRPLSPGCFYSGLARPQILKGEAQPFSAWAPERSIEMTGTIPIFKLHGSLNWTVNDQSIVAFQDMRPVFRHGGTAAIIPPVPEKTVPEWLHKVWDEAESSLRRSNTWVICGYSMPDYDKKVWELVQKAGSGRPLTIFLLSPEAKCPSKKVLKHPSRRHRYLSFRTSRRDHPAFLHLSS